MLQINLLPDNLASDNMIYSFGDALEVQWVLHMHRGLRGESSKQVIFDNLQIIVIFRITFKIEKIALLSTDENLNARQMEIKLLLSSFPL